MWRRDSVTQITVPSRFKRWASCEMDRRWGPLREAGVDSAQPEMWTCLDGEWTVSGRVGAAGQRIGRSVDRWIRG